jgi:hypothetical protein
MTVHFRIAGLGSWAVGVGSLLAVAACGGAGSTTDGDEDGHRLPVDGWAEAAEAVVDHGDSWPPEDGTGEGDDSAAEGSGDAEGCTPRLGGPCNVLEQCGCGPGDRCVLDYSGRTRPIEMCVAVGADPFGTLCDDGVDNCTAGSQCFPEGPSDGSGFFASLICASYCDSQLDCPGGWYCGGLAPGLSPGLPGYQVCGNPPQPCDPFTSEGCAPGSSCVVRSGDTQCRWAEAAGPGEPCRRSCAVGSWCPALDWGSPLVSDGICYQYCRLDGSLPDCSDIPGTVCAAVLGRPDVGICI